MSDSSKVVVHLQGKVPFAWENKPGVSKVTTQQECPTIFKLPPPPCPPDRKARVYAHDLQLRSLSKRGLKKHCDEDDDDPFFMAYKECTKSSTRVKSKVVGGDVKGKKNMFLNFSCKDSCSVRDDNLVKISQLPYSFSE